jgi:hypothetical protein
MVLTSSLRVKIASQLRRSNNHTLFHLTSLPHQQKALICQVLENEWRVSLEISELKHTMKCVINMCDFESHVPSLHMVVYFDLKNYLDGNEMIFSINRMFASLLLMRFWRVKFEDMHLPRSISSTFIKQGSTGNLKSMLKSNSEISSKSPIQCPTFCSFSMEQL